MMRPLTPWLINELAGGPPIFSSLETRRLGVMLRLQGLQQLTASARRSQAVGAAMHP